MRILVTGVSGQVGGALIPRLHRHELIAASRELLDLSFPQKIGEILDKLRPDLIINPAAYTAVDRAEDESTLATLINAEAPKTIAQWAAAAKIPFIHFSTDYVFDGSGERPWREDDAANPLSVYGASKLAGERAIRAAGGIFLIVRTCWIYSAKGKNFLRTIASLARERNELRIVDDQIGAPTSADLVAEAVSRMVSEGLEAFSARCAQANGIVHIATAGYASWYDFALAIVDGLKQRGLTLAVEQIQPITSDEYPVRAKRPRNSRLDLTRLRQVFGITPPPWRDALALELDRLIGKTPNGAVSW